MRNLLILLCLLNTQLAFAEQTITWKSTSDNESTTILFQKNCTADGGISNTIIENSNKTYKAIIDCKIIDINQYKKSLLNHSSIRTLN